jgi:hypothetical protein
MHIYVLSLNIIQRSRIQKYAARTIIDYTPDHHPASQYLESDLYRAHLRLDECQSLLSVDGDVLLMVVGVVPGAAVRVLRVAVRLDFGRVGRALEARGTSRELLQFQDVSVMISC